MTNQMQTGIAKPAGKGVMRKIIRMAVIAGSVLVCAVAIVVVFEIPLNLSPFKADIETATLKALGIDLAIEGDVYLIPGWWPALEMRKSRLSHAAIEDSADLLYLDYLKVGLAILPLLRRELRITELTAQGIDLKWPASGESNAESGNDTTIINRQEGDNDIVENETAIQKFEVTRIDLRSLTVAVQGEPSDYTLFFPEIAGSATDGEGLKLSVQGEYQHILWDMAINGGSLTALLARAGDWPLRLSVTGAVAELGVRGRIHPPAGSATLDLQLSGSTGPQLEAALGCPVPDFGDYRFAFHLDVAGSQVGMSELVGELGNTRFSGGGQWDGARGRFKGVVNAMAIDLEPLIGSIYPTGNQNAESPPHTSSGANKELPWRETLADLDVDFQISIGKIVGVPGELRNVTAHLVSTKNGIHLPVSMSVLGIAVSGEATLSLEETTTNFSVDLTGGQTNLGRVSETLPGGKGLTGKLDGFAFSAAATGKDLPTLLNNLEARLYVRNADLSIDNPFAIDPTRVVLKTATLSLPSGAGIKGTVAGRLVDKPFALNLTGGSMRDILEKTRWPVNLRFSGSGAKFHLAGTLSLPGGPVGADITLRLSGDRIGDLAAWTGVSPSAEMPYGLNTYVQLRQDRMQIDIHQLTAGNSMLRGVFEKEYSANRQPNSAVSISADIIDVRQLKTIFLLPDDGEKQARELKRQERTGDDFARILDTMVFPEEFHLPEMDLNLDIRRLVTDQLTYDRCSLKASIQKDHATTSDFKFDHGGVTFRGEAFLDLRGEPPVLGLGFSTNRYDLSELLDALNVAKGVDASVGTFEIHMTTRGRKLSDLILKREITIRVMQGRLVVKSAHTDFEINIDSAEYSDVPGEPFRLDVRGHIHDAPLTVRWVTQKDHSEDRPGTGLTSRLEAELADARLSISGQLVFPLRIRGIPHQLNISGKQLNSLEPLLNISLPPLGPYEVSGVIRILPEGYHLTDAVFSVGDSRFLGHIQIDSEDSRPKVAASLQAETINLQDFFFLDRELKPGEQLVALSKYMAHILDNTEYRRQLRQLFDPSAPSSIDADIAIEVSEVLAGALQIDGVTLRIIHEDSRLSVPMLSFSIFGGDVKSSLELIDTGDGVNGALKANIHQVDFGPLLQLKDPNAKNRSQVSMIIDLKSAASSAEMLMGEADGRFALLIHPENIGAGVFDFWATNLLLATLSVFNPDNKSKVNCVVADLTMAGGIMKEKTIVVDTSKIRVRGTANIDFKKQTVYLKLTPKPKRPQFLYLATPVEVRGAFSDFRTGLAPGGLPGTVIGLLTDPVVVPFQWIILNKLPKDGSDVCPDVIN